MGLMRLTSRSDEDDRDVGQLLENHPSGVVVVARIVDRKAAVMAVGEAYRGDETKARAAFGCRRLAFGLQHGHHSLMRLRLRRQEHPSESQVIEK